MPPPTVEEKEEKEEKRTSKVRSSFPGKKGKEEKEEKKGDGVFPVFINNIPYEEILDASIDNSELDIPTWAWENVERKIMTDPYVAASGRSYSLETLQSLTNERDPITDAAIPSGAPTYENWNLAKAIDQWIFDTTGFTLKEITDAEVERRLEKAFKLAEEGKTAEALDTYLSVLSLDSTNSDAFLEYALYMTDGESAKKILPLLNRALQLEPDDVDLILSHMRVMRMLEEWEKVLEDLNTIEEFDLDEAYKEQIGSILEKKAYALLNLDRYEEALKVINEDLKRFDVLDERAADALDTRAQILESMGRKEEAMADLKLVATFLATRLR